MKKNLVYILIILVYFFLMLLLVYFEHEAEDSSIKNLGNALWYVLVTLSTIGYGDYYPITALGKIVGIIFVLSSLGVMGYLISKLTINLNQYMEDKKAGLFGTKIENHIVIIGYDKFSNHIIKQIVPTGRKVAVVTNKKDDLDLIATAFEQKDVFTLYSDFENFENLSKVNITKSSKVFINFKDDAEMLIYILHLKTYYQGLNLVVSLDNSTLKKPFKSAGVLYVVSREEIAAKLVASYIFEPEVAIFTEDIMSSATGKFDFDILEFKIIEGNPYIGKKYNDTFFDLKEKFAAILLGIYQDEQLYKNPTFEMIIGENDYLILIANGESYDKIKEAFGTDQGRF